MDTFVVPTTLSPSPDPQTFEEACDTLRELQAEVGDVLNIMRAKGKDLIILRFRQGQVAHRALNIRGGYGEGLVNMLASHAGMASTILYSALQFYRHPQFRQSEHRLKQWMEDTEEEKGSITWTYCRNWAAKQLPEKEEDAETKLLREAEKLEKSAAKLEHKAIDLEQEVERWNGEADSDKVEELLGVAAKAKEVANDTRRQAREMGLEKPQRYESEKYLSHVRKYGCLICGKEKSDAHHIAGSGMGTKNHDVFTVPLCRIHHTELHSKGADPFWHEMEVNPWQNVAYLLASFMTGRELT